MTTSRQVRSTVLIPESMRKQLVEMARAEASSLNELVTRLILQQVTFTLRDDTTVLDQLVKLEVIIPEHVEVAISAYASRRRVSTSEQLVTLLREALVVSKDQMNTTPRGVELDDP